MADSSIEAVSSWSTVDSSELYDIARWGKGFFSVGNGGHLLVHPTKSMKEFIDLKHLVDRLQIRGIDLPILVRFGQILQRRISDLAEVFQKAIREHDYQGKYFCVYPIKVNQQRQVIEEVLHYGRQFGFGLEAGSKPELLAVTAMASNDTPIICNGFKDAEYLEMVMHSHLIGRNIITVIEKFNELELALQLAEKVGVRPQLGVRVKLAAKGSGRWQGSGGYRSKFGLSASEILKVLDILKQRGMQDCLKLMHFHLGSQITNIRRIKEALIEGSRMYVELKRAGAGLQYLDVGGGLGVDYDGSQTAYESSVNYTLDEYAADVVYHIRNICQEANVPHPHIISESGRALVAYSSMLVIEVLDVAGLGDTPKPPTDLPPDVERPLLDLQDAYKNLNGRQVLECFHDAQQAFDMAMSLFSNGYLPIERRCLAENLFWAICRKVYALVQELDHVPEELSKLDELLSETYFCNFSLFQSVPDSWAIKQLFPIAPIHRMNERPTKQAVLGDITCDSDGKVDRFIHCHDVRRTLMLHPFNNGPYYLGVFLVGAYQEILGDLHNLFGDTNAVHVRLGTDGQVILDEVVKGDTVQEVLDYVEFDTKALVQKLRTDVDIALREQRVTDQQAGAMLRFYEEGLHGYTYLEKPDSPLPPVSGNGAAR